MKWLETPRDDAERLIREGLDQAAQRTGDEIMHRRVWAHLAELEPSPAPRSYVRLAVATASLGVLAVAGAITLPYLLRQHDTSNGIAKVDSPSVSHPKSPSGVAKSPAKSDTPDEPLVSPERVPGNVVATRRGERARVALGGGAEAELAEDSAITWDRQSRPSVERGVARLSVPHQPPGWRFSVTAGPYVVTVVGTKFEVKVQDRTVGVSVTEGVVEVWRGSRATRLVAGDSWNGPRFLDDAQPAPLRAPVVQATKPAKRGATQAASKAPVAVAPAPAEQPLAIPPPPTVLARPGLEEAQSALAAGDTTHAVELLTRMAQGAGPAAENAAYELARVTRYNLNRPRQAVALWDKYRKRFPSGLLRTEADLSIVETLSQLGDTRAALAEANAFLARHPTSERRADVQRLAERLRAATPE
jgi:hypothetical protein